MRLDDLLAAAASGAYEPVRDIGDDVWRRIETRRRRMRELGVAAHALAVVGAICCSFWVSHIHTQTALNRTAITLAMSENLAVTAVSAF